MWWNSIWILMNNSRNKIVIMPILFKIWEQFFPQNFLKFWEEVNLLQWGRGKNYDCLDLCKFDKKGAISNFLLWVWKIFRHPFLQDTSWWLKKFIPQITALPVNLFLKFNQSFRINYLLCLIYLFFGISITFMHF